MTILTKIPSVWMIFLPGKKPREGTWLNLAACIQCEQIVGPHGQLEVQITWQSGKHSYFQGKQAQVLIKELQLAQTRIQKLEVSFNGQTK